MKTKSEKVVSALKSSNWIIGYLVISLFIQQTALQTCVAIRMDAQSYQRGRLYDPVTGRFNRLDPFYGEDTDPQSFHKYTYVHGDPINNIDPTGEFAISASAVGSYVVTQALVSGLQTLVEATIIHSLNRYLFYDDPIEFNAAQNFGENFAVNLVTAGIGGTAEKRL